jgi:hypothetical protein
MTRCMAARGIGVWNLRGSSRGSLGTTPPAAFAPVNRGEREIGDEARSGCHCGFGKFAFLNGNGLLGLLNLNREASIGTRDRPPEGGFHPLLLAVIRVVDLCGIAAEWRFGITQHAYQQSGRGVKIKLCGRLIIANS